MKDEYLYASETCMLSTKITIPETMVRYKRENRIVGITEFVDKINEVLNDKENILDLWTGKQDEIGTDLFIKLSTRNLTREDVITLQIVTNYINQEEIKNHVVSQDTEYSFTLYQKMKTGELVESMIRARLIALNLHNNYLLMKFSMVSIEV